MNALTVPEIENLRALILANAKELVAEADLLFTHKRFARTFSLAHLSSEELAKLPLLAATGVSLVNGQTVSWEKVDKQLRSHFYKLKALLLVDLLGKNIDPSAREIQVHKQSLSRVELFNELKNVSLYAGVYQDSMYKPSDAIPERLASEALTLARNRLEHFATIEAVTHGRIAELAQRASYLRLLNTLGVAGAA
jgi:AbiV family abortive infection protein